MGLGMQLASRGWHIGRPATAKDSSTLNPSILGGGERRGECTSLDSPLFTLLECLPNPFALQQRLLLLFSSSSIHEERSQFDLTAGRLWGSSWQTSKTSNMLQNHQGMKIFPASSSWQHAITQEVRFPRPAQEPDTVGFIKPHGAKKRPHCLGSCRRPLTTLAESQVPHTLCWMEVAQLLLRDKTARTCVDTQLHCG